MKQKYNYLEVNRIWAREHNKWLYAYNVFSYIKIILFTAMIILSVIFIINLEFNPLDFAAFPVSLSSNNVVVYINFHISYYWLLSLYLFVWGALILVYLLNVMNLTWKLVTDRINIRHQKLLYSFLALNIFWLLLLIALLLYLCLVGSSVIFNIPDNLVATSMNKDSTYYREIVGIYNKWGNLNFNNQIVSAFLIGLVVGCISMVVVLIAFVIFSIKKIGALAVNPNKYLQSSNDELLDDKILRKVNLLENKIKKLKNKI